MGVSGAQNRSELKWERTNRVDFQVTSFTVSESKIEQETLFSLLTWKIQNPLGWVYGMGLFCICCLSWNIYRSEWPKFIFSTWKKIPPGQQNVLASYWTWKINTVSPQEIREGLDKVIFQLLSPLLLFSLCIWNMHGKIRKEKKIMGALSRHKQACRASVLLPNTAVLVHG